MLTGTQDTQLITDAIPHFLDEETGMDSSRDL